jgi:hypothetical protein
MTATPLLAPPAASRSRESWTTVIRAPRDTGLNEGGQGGGVLIGVDAAGAGVDLRHRSPADFGKKLREMRSGFLTADVLDVGASHALVGYRFAVLEADAPRLGAADVEADHDVVGLGGAGRVFAGRDGAGRNSIGRDGIGRDGGRTG